MSARRKTALLRSASKALRGDHHNLIPSWAIVAVLAGRLR